MQNMSWSLHIFATSIPYVSTVLLMSVFLLNFAVPQLGLAAGCNQLNFTVLDWNKSSLDFYLSQGCFDVTADLGYHNMRCEGEALQHLAQP